MTRLQQILGALLAIQLALVIVVFWPRAANAGADGPLFPDLVAEDVVGLSIADDQGNAVTLERAGDGWVLASGGDYPARAEAVSPILEKILGLQTSRLVASSTAGQRQLQVTEDTFLRRVELALADGETAVLYLGSSPSAGATHMRRGGEDETYLTADLAVFELSAAASNWVDPVYVSLVRDALSGLTLENDQGTFNFAKADDGTWSFVELDEGETFADTAFSTLLNRLLSLRLVQPLGIVAEPAYGMAEPRAVVTVTGTDGTSTLTVGAVNPESGNYIVKWSESDYYVEIAPIIAESFANQTRDDLLVPPPTPEPTQTPVEPIESEPASEAATPSP